MVRDLDNDLRLSSQYSFTKVLIVEDIAYTKRQLKKKFKDNGYFVLTASNGEEGVEKIKRYNPDIITFGHDLTDMAVTSFLNTARSICEARIIFIPSKADTDIFSKENSPYINDIVRLPINDSDLKGRISKLLSK